MAVKREKIVILSRGTLKTSSLPACGPAVQAKAPGAPSCRGRIDAASRLDELVEDANAVSELELLAQPGAELLVEAIARRRLECVRYASAQDHEHLSRRC